MPHRLLRLLLPLLLLANLHRRLLRLRLRLLQYRLHRLLLPHRPWRPRHPRRLYLRLLPAHRLHRPRLPAARCPRPRRRLPARDSLN